MTRANAINTLSIVSEPDPREILQKCRSHQVSFDRYFRGLTPSEQKDYQGKHDLEWLGVPNLKEILLKLQSGLNFAPEHRDHPPFHMDYIESEIPNALAFRYDAIRLLA